MGKANVFANTNSRFDTTSPGGKSADTRNKQIVIPAGDRHYIETALASEDMIAAFGNAKMIAE